MDLQKQQQKRQEDTPPPLNSGFSQIFSFRLQEHPLQPHMSQMQLQWMGPPENQQNC